MNQDALLQVEGLTKTFTIHHLDRTIPAFQELDFSLHSGEFLLVRPQWRRQINDDQNPYRYSPPNQWTGIGAGLHAVDAAA